MAFDERAIDTALAEFDGERDAHGATADNDDLMPFGHGGSDA